MADCMASKEEALQEIKEKILKEMVCPLKDSATNLVFGKGNPNAPILFIGEAPGEQEDMQGIPFVGSAGKQLDKLLHSIGLSLDDVYIANILKYRPPQNRNPTMEEIVRHTPYLVEQIKVIQPKIIATLGNFAAKFVLAHFQSEDMVKIPGVSQLHGNTMDLHINGMHFTVFPLYHPAACLYRPQLREVLVQDFAKMGQFLGLAPQPQAEMKKVKSLKEFF